MEAGNKTVLCPGCGALNTDHAGFCSACGEEITREAVRILPVGTNLDQGRYTVTGFVGRGGSAITYRARQRNFSQEIVLREYYPSVIAKRAQDNRNVIPTALQIENDFERGKIQFRKEGDSLRSLRDIPNIVTVYDVFEDNNTVYMVEDYIKGESLQTFLTREGKLSFRQAMKILTPVMKALAAVHSHEILHRDVKPSNIMLENGAPCLIDFGISRKIREMTTLSSEPGPKIRTIASSYTKGYAALEQITGEERETAAVDVYGAAATLYRMVTGVSPDDALSRQRQDYLLPPIEAGAHISKRQSDIIMQGLSLYAKDRFQTMQAFLNLLEESLEEPKQEEAVKVKKDPPKRAFPWIILLNALLAFCIVLLLVTRILPLLRGGNAADPAVSAPAEEKEENDETVQDLSVMNFQYKGHTYALYSLRSTGVYNLDSYEAFCKKAGGYPAVISSQDENTIIYNQLLASGYETAFFGYMNHGSPHIWTWQGREESRFSFWSSRALDKLNEQNRISLCARFHTAMLNGQWEPAEISSQS